jgi:hypothetical protein
MTHQFVKNAPIIVKTALGLLRQDNILASLVYRDADDAFAGRQGDTVNVKRPSVLSATDIGFRNAARTVTGSDLKESSFPVKLDQYPVSAVDLTDEEMSLDVEDFNAQVVQPQVRAMSDFFEIQLALRMVSDTATGALVAAANGSDALAKITHARTLLNTANVSRANRVLLVGSAVEETLLGLAILTEAQSAGTTDALREAILGRLRGFTVVASNSIDPTTAIAMHPTAFALVTRAPVIPDGVSFGATASYDGIAMRWVKDYDANKLTDRSVLGTFCGITAVKDPVDITDPAGTQSMQRAVQIQFTA